MFSPCTVDRRREGVWAAGVIIGPPRLGRFGVWVLLATRHFSLVAALEFLRIRDRQVGSCSHRALSIAEAGECGPRGVIIGPARCDDIEFCASLVIRHSPLVLRLRSQNPLISGPADLFILSR